MEMSVLGLQAFPWDQRGSVGESFPPTAAIHTPVSSHSEGGEKTDCGKAVDLSELALASPNQFSSTLLERDLSFPLPGGLDTRSGKKEGVKVSFHCKSFPQHGILT